MDTTLRPFKITFAPEPMNAPGKLIEWTRFYQDWREAILDACDTVEREYRNAEIRFIALAPDPRHTPEPTTAPVVVIRRDFKGKCFTADYSQHPDAPELQRLFGTTLLPLPWAVTADPERVRASFIANGGAKGAEVIVRA